MMLLDTHIFLWWLFGDPKLPNRSWDIEHRDPFDRMLAAQSKLENMPLATLDKKLPQFPIEIMDGGLN